VPGGLSAYGRLFLTVSALAVAPTWALDVTQYGVFTCDVGDCVNGGGRARETLTGTVYEGPWSGGNTIPGQVYRVTHPAAPDRSFKATFGPDGLQDGGDMVFGGVSQRSLAVFSGTYAHIDHPSGKKVAVMKRGRLDNGLGFVYQGRFEFLPAKASIGHVMFGTYIFFGSVIDTEENTKETGLYVTDAQLFGSAPHFQKANPAFLANLQSRYREEMGGGRGGSPDSAERMGKHLAIVDKIATGISKPGVSASVEGVAADAAMSVMTDTIKNDDSKLSAEDATIRAIERAASNDDEARRQVRALLKP
jgi:hypothetical protein